jgi:Cu/Ag efflux protein CusF
MKKSIVVLMVVVFGLVMVNGVMAEEKAASKTAKPSGMKEQTVSVTGTVTAIDLSNRVVTLKGPKGNVFDLKVGEEAQNLSQVKVGDQVNIKYYESLAFQVTKPGQASTVGATSAVARAKPGEKPGGTVANQVTVTGTVEAIDAKTRRVTLKAPDGKSKEIKVKDPKNLKNVKVGDEVVFTYTEALAISVAPVKKK